MDNNFERFLILPMNQETKDKIGNANSGKNNGMYGKKPWNIGLTKETDERVKTYSEKLKGKHLKSNGVLEEWNKTHQPWNKGLKGFLSKENHWNWKGGINPKNDTIRKSVEIKLWHKAVLERDYFTCQKCKVSGGKLNAHHINNFADFPELRTSIENGIIFCKKCHILFHKKYGFRNNTREQLIKFL